MVLLERAVECLDSRSIICNVIYVQSSFSGFHCYITTCVSNKVFSIQARCRSKDNFLSCDIHNMDFRSRVSKESIKEIKNYRLTSQCPVLSLPT